MQYIESDMFAPHAGGSSYTKFKESLYGKRYSPNYFADGIEICVNPDSDINQTLENAAWLAAKLLKEQGKTPDKWLFRHYDMTGKSCPAFMIDESTWRKYRGNSKIEFMEFSEFKSMVQTYFDHLEITAPLVVKDGFSSREGKLPSQYSDWARPAIEALKKLNILNDEVFSNYQDKVTRKRFAYLSVKLYEQITGDKITEMAPKGTFSDTNDEYVLRAVNLGIVSGYGDRKFGPNDLLTREQAAQLLINVCKKSGMNLDGSRQITFKDQDMISPWAIEAVDLAYANGFISGVGNDRFDPKGPATNEQSLQLVFNVLKKARMI